MTDNDKQWPKLAKYITGALVILLVISILTPIILEERERNQEKREIGYNLYKLESKIAAVKLMLIGFSAGINSNDTLWHIKLIGADGMQEVNRIDSKYYSTAVRLMYLAYQGFVYARSFHDVGIYLDQAEHFESRAWTIIGGPLE